MIRVFSISLIAVGSFLEIFYYQYRFTADGIAPWLAVTIGVALTLLLSLSVYMRKMKWAVAIIVLVSFYSIFATSAGQAFSLNESVNIELEQTTENIYRQQEIQEIETEIQGINKELSVLQTATEESITNLEDAWYYKNTLAQTRERIAELNAKKDDLREQLSTLRSNVTVHESQEKRSRNIYTFYGNMLHIDDTWLQFVLQTVLSAFIAVMAPLGIITIQNYKKPVKQKKEKYDPNIISRWVHRNWIGIRSGKSKKILPLKTYEEFLKNRNEPFDRQEYNQLFDRAKHAGAIAEDGRIIEKDEKKAINMLNI